MASCVNLATISHKLPVTQFDITYPEITRRSVTILHQWHVLLIDIDGFFGKKFSLQISCLLNISVIWYLTSICSTHTYMYLNNIEDREKTIIKKKKNIFEYEELFFYYLNHRLFHANRFSIIIWKKRIALYTVKLNMKNYSPTYTI